MKQSGFILLAAAFCVGACSRASAQASTYHRETPVEKATKTTRIMTCELNLGTDEIPKVQAVNVMTAKTVDSIQENVKDYSAKKRLMTKLEKKQEAGLRDAMTDEHYIYYLKIVDHDSAAMKATKACREGQDTW